MQRLELVVIEALEAEVALVRALELVQELVAVEELRERAREVQAQESVLVLEEAEVIVEETR